MIFNEDVNAPLNCVSAYGFVISQHVHIDMIDFFVTLVSDARVNKNITGLSWGV